MTYNHTVRRDGRSAPRSIRYADSGPSQAQGIDVFAIWIFDVEGHRVPDTSLNIMSYLLANGGLYNLWSDFATQAKPAPWEIHIAGSDTVVF